MNKAKKPAAKKHGEISHIVTTRGENGVMNEVHKVPGAGYEYEPPEKYFHDSAEKAGNHVSTLMGGKNLMGDGDGDEAA